MILMECVTAYMAVQELMEQPFPYKAAHELMMLKRKMQPHVEFFAREEMKLVEEFAQHENGKILWTDKGAFRFAAGKDPREYASRRENLSSTDIGWIYERIKIPFPASIKPAQLEALEKFIEFEEAAV